MQRFKYGAIALLFVAMSGCQTGSVCHQSLIEEDGGGRFVHRDGGGRFVHRDGPGSGKHGICRRGVLVVKD